MNDKNVDKVRIEHLKQQIKKVIIGEDANNIVIVIVIVLVWMDLNSYKKNTLKYTMYWMITMEFTSVHYSEFD